jgi:hypothetical protein
MMTPTPHTAGPALVGYLYQVELALLEWVRRTDDNPSVSVALEVLDDVSFNAYGKPVELLQSKHHKQGVASLTDASPDLWGGIAGWIDALPDIADVADISLSLVTTAAAPTASIASLLRREGRDPVTALARLEQVATTSTNEANRPAYAKLLALSKDERLLFVEAITVLDLAPHVTDIKEQLGKLLRRSIRPQHLAAFVERLLEWWHRRALRHLVESPPTIPVSADELDIKLVSLRDDFTAQNLPMDVGWDDVPSPELSDDQRIFVLQLQLIAAARPAIEEAIRNYKRAFLQRSRWLEDRLIDQEELSAYESQLIDEWRHQFALIQDVHGMSDTDLERAGFELYRELQALDLPIREKFQHRFVGRGTYHALADDRALGWHPLFVDRLKAILEEAPST